MASNIFIKYEWFEIIWPIDRTPTSTTTPSQNTAERTSNEEVFHSFYITRIGASPSDAI